MNLPKKTERIEWCGMTETQVRNYRAVLQRSRQMLLENADKQPSPALFRASTNVLVELCKAAIHPALFRVEYDDALLKELARACKLDEQWKDSNEAYILEDLYLMTDSELQHFCQTHGSIAKFARSKDMFLNSGKITALLQLLVTCREAKRRVLIISQFVQVLDILRAVLDLRAVRYLTLTGSTPLDARSSLVDEFTRNESIDVILLSTAAGNLDIDLTAASVVVLLDQGLNPHNDNPAVCRAYRSGQKNEVDVIKFISRGTIEEDILRLGETFSTNANTDNPGGAAGDEVKASLFEIIEKQPGTTLAAAENPKAV